MRKHEFEKNLERQRDSEEKIKSLSRQINKLEMKAGWVQGDGLQMQDTTQMEVELRQMLSDVANRYKGFSIRPGDILEGAQAAKALIDAILSLHVHRKDTSV